MIAHPAGDNVFSQHVPLCAVNARTGAPALPSGGADVTAEPTAAGHQTSRSRSQHQRRKRILQAAAALASRGGVEAMQMRTVAERAGVALGTLYRYFPSKMDLVVAVVNEEMDTLEASLDRRPPSSGTPAGRAVEVLMRATRGLMREPELADALIRSLLLSDVKTDLGDRMAGMLARVADEDARPGEEHHVLLRSLSSVWVMEMIELLRGHSGDERIQARLEIAAERLLAGF
jgi:TetR/AcrR family transcriptional regulator, cholesterol catabolism regulator